MFPIKFLCVCVCVGKGGGGGGGGSSIHDILLWLTGLLTCSPQSVVWPQVAEGSWSFQMQHMRQSYRRKDKGVDTGRERI